MFDDVLSSNVDQEFQDEILVDVQQGKRQRMKSALSGAVHKLSRKRNIYQLREAQGDLLHKEVVLVLGEGKQIDRVFDGLQLPPHRRSMERRSMSGSGGSGDILKAKVSSLPEGTSITPSKRAQKLGDGNAITQSRRTRATSTAPTVDPVDASQQLASSVGRMESEASTGTSINVSVSRTGVSISC